MKNIKRYFYTYKILLSNFSYLSLLEIFGLLFPLLSYPYLIRVLGKELYGAVVYAQSIMAYITIIINFGFNVSATKDISENRNNTTKLKEIFSSVIILKIIIAIIVLLIYCFCVYYFHPKYQILYLASIGLCLQEIFFPTWFFQGVERMKYITYISFFSRLFFLICIFLFIRNNSDYFLVPVINSLGGLFAAVISLIIIKLNFDVSISKVTLKTMKQYFTDSIPFFLSRLSAIVSEKTNTILLGAFVNFSCVASYDLALKVINIAKTPFMLIAQVLYPSVTKSKNMVFVKKVINIATVAAVILSCIIFIAAKYIIIILGGQELLDAVNALKILSAYLPIVCFSTLCGASTLVVMGYSRHYNLSVVYGAIIYILLSAALYFTKAISIYSMAISFILPELVIALYRILIVKNKKIFRNVGN